MTCKLEPCPFSHEGYDKDELELPKVLDPFDNYDSGYSAYCPTCLAEGPCKKTAAEAEAAWNKRAVSKERIKFTHDRFFNNDESEEMTTPTFADIKAAELKYRSANVPFHPSWSIWS